MAEPARLQVSFCEAFAVDGGSGGWWQDLWAPLAIAGGVLLGRQTAGKKEEKEGQCETCQGRGLLCPPQGLPPAQFWIALTTGTVAVIVGYTTLQIEVRELRLWRDQTSSNRFTSSDGKQMEILLRKEIEAERSFSKGLCQDLKRVQIELGRVPRNGCDGS